MTLRLTRAEFANTAQALEREWLVTNGLGGFAAGTVAQANTRRYHGLLMAALRPPVERVLLVSKIDVAVDYQGRRFELADNEFADGTLTPRGHELLVGFELDDGIPTWRYALGDARLTQRLWMDHGRNTTRVSFTLDHASSSARLELTPLCTYRDYHAHSRGGWPPAVEAFENGCTVIAFQGARAFRVELDRGAFEPRSDWYWGFRHRKEAERGLDALEDLFRPGVLQASLVPGETLIFTASAEPEAAEAGTRSFERERRRLQSLLVPGPSDAPNWIRQLALAADQFIVRRGALQAAEPQGTTIIAGYPWFGDWGRDTMIALPGLTLGTGRAQDAAAILRTFAEYVSRGMLPNRFPDGGEAPEYNTADATLWYFHAISSYIAATSDLSLLRDLYPTLKEIIRWHEAGTRYGIGVDQHDGLLRVGEPGVQLTWMDAKIGDWVVTPRTGKPVEINALWHFALLQMTQWARLLADRSAESGFERASARVRAAFSRAFWCKEAGHLFDVVDGPDGHDPSLRPNQIFAVSLGGDLLSPNQARSVVDVCGRELLTPVGLRSLDTSGRSYAGAYRGAPAERDAVYHQGTVWSWLLGPFALAHHEVYRDPAYALAVLSGLAAHLGEECLGTISEIFDGDAPHAPRGCCAQAWSVAETLRAWNLLTRAQVAQRVPVARTAGAGA